ncbi:MAG: 7TM diverse intracellular signaling domain-containing protein, partial [Bacteroidota bacterium]
MINRLCFSLTIIGILLLVTGKIKANNSIPVVINGIINLSDYDFEEQGNIKLQGKWKFYSNKFLNPEQIKNDKNYSFLDVPKNWKGQAFNNEILDAKGYGTYYLQIIIGDNHRNELFIFNTRYIPNSSEIYVNGKKVGFGGKTGENKDSSEASLDICFDAFAISSDTLDLIIHVSNYHLNKGGIYYEIELGHANDISKSKTIKNVKIFFIIGSIFLMILYYFILFLLRKKEKSPLFFSILCFCIATYTLCLSDLYFNFFPFTGFVIDYKIKHILIYLALLAMSVYIYHIFKNEFSRFILKIILATSILFSLAMIILSTNLNSFLFSYFRYFGIFVTMYIIYVIIRAKINKREGAGIFILGLLIVFLAVINDSLYGMRIILTTDLLPLAMFLFLFLQTYILSSRFTKSFAKTEELTEELTYINKNLENIVIERTQEISYQKKEIEEKNEELSQLLEEVTTQRDEIEAQRDLVTNQKEQIEIIHHEISQSIDYAKRIQSSILSDVSILDNYLPDYFILFKPRDKVSGDFYWWREVEGHLLITAADCTGHGVPGGFMSMLGISFMREIIVKEYVTHPGVILRRLRKEIINVMKQKGETGEQKDGMDMALISINLENKLLQFSGANNPMYLIRDGEMTEYKGDKMPI